MAVKDVIVRLFGDDKDLTTKLDRADARLSEFARENPTAKLAVDDANATAILDDMKLRLTEYGKMTETARVKVDDAQALFALDKLDLKMALLKHRMDSLGSNMNLGGLSRARVEMDSIARDVAGLGGGGGGSRGGFFSRLLEKGFGLGGGGGGGGILGGAGGAASGGSGAGSGILSSLAGANNAYTGGGIGVLLALAGSIAPAILPFIGGAGIGLGGAFLAGSLGAKGAQAIAGDKYALAQAKAAISGSSKGGSPSQLLALQHAQKQLAHDQSLYGGFAPFGHAVTNLGHTGLNTLAGAMSANAPGANGRTVPGTSFLSGLTGILGQISGFVKSVGPELGAMFRASIPFVKAFATIMEQLAKQLMPAFTQSMRQLTPFLPQIIQGFKYLSEGVASFIKDLGPGMKDATTVFKALMLGVKGILIGLAYTFDGLAIFFAKWGHNVKVGVTAIWHALKAMWHFVVSDALSAWHKLKALEQQGLHDIAHVFDTIRHTVATIWDHLWHDVPMYAERGVLLAYTLVRLGLDRIIVNFSGLPGRAVRALISLGRDLYNIGVSAMQGLWNGLVGMGNRIIGWVEGFAGKIGSAFRSVLGIFSPSKVMHDIGTYIMLGLTGGMESSSHLVTDSARRIAAGVPAAFSHSYISTSPSFTNGRVPTIGGAGGTAQIVVTGQGDDLVKAIVKSLRYEIRQNGGGSVQQHLGWGSA